MILSLVLLGGLLTACSQEAGPASGYPCSDCNVILISLDTLRADHLSAYGYERPTSPVLEALAEDGVLFESFVHNGGG